MKVLLLEDVKGVGKKGAVVEVKVGYGNNFLIKNKKALLADEETIKQYEQDERSAKARLDSHNKELVELAHKIEKLDISIAHKCGKDNMLFGAVTTAHISDALKKYNVVVDKKHITIPSPIKTLGEHQVVFKLGNGINADIKINVISE